MYMHLKTEAQNTWSKSWQTERKKRQVSHLIIVGDFNTSLSEFEKKKKDRKSISI